MTRDEARVWLARHPGCAVIFLPQKDDSGDDLGIFRISQQGVLSRLTNDPSNRWVCQETTYLPDSEPRWTSGMGRFGGGEYKIAQVDDVMDFLGVGWVQPPSPLREDEEVPE